MQEKHLGVNIRKLRKEHGLTQMQLAEKMGLGATAIVNYESGYSAPPANKLPKLAKALGVSLDRLFEGCYED